MTESQRSKIYDHNFDTFVSKPIMAELQQEGVSFLGDYLKSQNGLSPLPIPPNFDRSLSEAAEDKHTPVFQPKSQDSSERTQIASFLFPECVERM